MNIFKKWNENRGNVGYVDIRWHQEQCRIDIGNLDVF